jgi:hypothetical protein
MNSLTIPRRSSSPSLRPVVLFALITLVLVAFAGCSSPASPQLSAEDIRIRAGQDAVITELTNNQTYIIGNASRHTSRWDSDHEIYPPHEVWIVPLFVCYKDEMNIHSLEMTPDGKFYHVSGIPSHISYPPAELRANITGPCY